MYASFIAINPAPHPLPPPPPPPAVYASFIAIIAGLGVTLLLLALTQKALPALPVSIALGVLFYFVTRLAMEPFLVPLSVLGVMY